MLEEAAIVLSSIRRLPQTLDAVEGAAHALRRNAEDRKVTERAWSMFASGVAIGALFIIILFLLARPA